MPDSKRLNLEFQVVDEVLSPTKGVIRFNIKVKFSLRYKRPSIIKARVGKLAYRLEFPKSIKGLHIVIEKIDNHQVRFNL
jgi:hypothetical protein